MKSKSSIFTTLIILAAALFIITPESLFSVDKGETDIHPGCGTFLTKDQKDKLMRAWHTDSTGHPVLAKEKTYLSPRGLFLVHYATEGTNMPPMEDKNSNGTPDFVDSVGYYFDKAYELQVEQIGFLSPIPDDGAGGSDAFDIYLWDLGNGDDYDVPVRSNGGYYGLNNPYNFRPSHGAVQPEYTYIIIDNDFSSSDSVRPGVGINSYQAYKTFGIDALKITATHEFQHAIQFTYGLKDNDPKLTIMEMCGVFMEYRQYPEIKDYIQYVNFIFKNMNLHPLGSEDPFAGYGNSVFMQFLRKSYGDAVFKKLWEDVGSGMDVYTALDAALKDQGTSLDEKYTEFAGWLYHTGSRSVAGKYLDDSKLMNEMDFFQNEALGSKVLSMPGNMKPYEIRLLRLTSFPADTTLSEDSLDVLIVNRDLDAAHANNDVERQYSFSFAKIQPGGMDPVPELSWYYSAANDSHINYVLIPKPGVKSIQAASAFPNPYYPSTDEGINLPVPESADLYSNNNLQVVIYSPDMAPVYSGFIKVAVAGGKAMKTVRVPLGTDLKSGIYLYKVFDGNQTNFGKFAVKNR